MAGRDALHRFLAGHRAAEARALEVIRHDGPRSPEEAFARALELFDLVEGPPADPLRARDDAQARTAWAKVRAWAAGRRPRS